jgi:hypothetical protein
MVRNRHVQGQTRAVSGRALWLERTAVMIVRGQRQRAQTGNPLERDLDSRRAHVRLAERAHAMERQLLPALVGDRVDRALGPTSLLLGAQRLDLPNL